MKQTTLFDFRIEKLKSTELKSETDNTANHKLQKVIYKPSSLDSDHIDDFNILLTDWIYPTNYPVRDYQLQIVHQCLYKNTLVCLPTGLGKTFIATVVMFNFYRWYPNKKIVFVAPTRPLVRQQMLSASDCVPIDNNDVVEMTGSIAQNAREAIWRQKRVFFLTAQVFVNDLMNGSCPISDVIMVVFDEAHKATGNHAYCQIVRLLSGGSRLYRVLGLSATPGNDIETIQSVIQNLLISHIELRTDECHDIKMYSHERLVEEIVVPLGTEVCVCRDRLYSICEPLIERLKAVGAVKPSLTVRSGSKFGMLTQKEEYKRSWQPNLSQRVLTDFAMLISLYHALELVQQHGLRPLYQFLSNSLTTNSTMPHIADLMRNNVFMDILRDLEQKFQQSDVFVGGHPKLEKLKEIVKFHFEKDQNSHDIDSPCHTRVMVFSQFRDSVNEILRLLEQLRPLVRPMGFVGQANKGSQKEQMEAMRQFIAGTVNVLVSTCIGEEGLDVGEVDLIVCFDAQGSPIRLVQRLGRTGRKRQGRIVMLLSEGKEVSSYHSSLNKKSRIHSAIFEGYKHLLFYPDNPRLVPIGLEPTVTFQKYKLTKKLLPLKLTKSNPQKPIVANIGNFSQLQNLNFEPDSVGRMLIIGDDNSAGVTFSERYNVNRHRKSLYQSQKTFRIGHSTLTESVVSILKLKEMHRRGKTNMIYHLNNSRTVNIEEPMTQDGDESVCSQHSLQSFSVSLSPMSNENGDSQIKRPIPHEEFELLLQDLALKKEEIDEDMSDFSFSSASFAALNSSFPEEAPKAQEQNELIEAAKKETENVEEDIVPGQNLEENQTSFEKMEVEEDFFNFDFDSSPEVEERPTTAMDLVNVEQKTAETEINLGHKFDDKPSNNLSSVASGSLLNPDRKLSLLSSFKLNKPTISAIGVSPLGSFSKAAFHGKTSTPIRGDKRKSLLNSFHNSNIGFDTAMDLIDTSVSMKYELSTDLFDDDEDFLFDDSKEESRKVSIKIDNRSALLSTFRVTAVKDLEKSSRTDKDEKVLNSDEDLFSNDSDDDSHLYSPPSHKLVDSDDDSHLYSPLSNNLEGFSETGQTILKGEDSGGSNDSDCFLKTNTKKVSRVKSSSLDVNSLKRTNISFHSPGFETKHQKMSQMKSPSFENSCSQQTNISCHSPSFDSTFDNDDIKADLDLCGRQSPKPYEFSNKSITKITNAKRPNVRDFFLSQADMSDDDNNHSDDHNSSGTDLDAMESSFIDDNMTQTINSTQMQQIYVQSLQSPGNGRNYSRQINMSRGNRPIVDSQVESDDEYECDSFVVPDNYRSPQPRKTNIKRESHLPVASNRFKRLTVMEDSFQE